MADNKPKQETSFATQQFNQTLSSHTHILKEYKSKIGEASKLVGNTPIFLDTSVILSIYEISFNAREKIKQFLTSHKKRIVLTRQVQFEFIKNREKVINTFQSDVTEQLPTNFKGEVLNKLIGFNNSNKTKLEDYPDIQEKLQKLEENIMSLQTDIQDKVNDKKGSANSILLDDQFMDILAKTHLLESLDSSHLKLIKEDYGRLLPQYKSSADVYNINTFPGCAEKGGKDDPTGDFIIFHEMMEYAKKHHTDVIFLTNDTAKGDWLRKDGKTHFHYVENFYLNTEQIIFILNAERLFGELFETSFESLIEQELDTDIILNKDSLLHFLNSYKPFNAVMKELTIEKMSVHYIVELNLNKFLTVKDLKSVLDTTSNIIDDILLKRPTLNKIGLLRVCLKVANPDYRQLSENGHISQDSEKYSGIRAKWQKMR
ncbi:hypothetical protein BC343_22655 [Mucilaginibacter pedocola]|uniref:PIN like domain-containing protein n=2 Tax=Mucilaginibacter pedocola TaxID=1792845 RepID=A0A1S9PII3_9SPHI|nr:hypothetical protein BC343_22655 [Mucilaginibacter pedocola]